jgi:hypothetical protein
MWFPEREPLSGRMVVSFEVRYARQASPASRIPLKEQPYDQRGGGLMLFDFDVPARLATLAGKWLTAQAKGKGIDGRSTA